MQLWLAVTDTNEILCVGVTEIREYPNYKVCDAKIVTGKRYKEWFDQIDKVAEWAKEQGCKKMESFQDQVMSLYLNKKDMWQHMFK